MEVEFGDGELKRIDEEPGYSGGMCGELLRAFKKVLRFIRAAVDERDFRAMRSLNFEKLKGKRDHQHSMRINRQWRLIVEIKESNPKNIIVLVGLEDYH